MCFGEIQTDRSLPSLDTIAEQVEENGLIEKDGNLLGIQEGSDGNEYHVSDDYFFVHYVKEVSENHPKIDRGRIRIGENTHGRLMRFLLTQTGRYVCESTSQVEDNDALEYLIGRHSSGIDFECDRKNQFDREQMKQFYDDAWKVRGLKLKRKDGIRDNTDINGDVEKYIKNAVKSIVRAEFSTEQQDKDLQQSDIIDGFVNALDIHKVRIKNDSGKIRVMFQDGKYSIRHPSKLDIQQQSKEIYNILLSMIDGFAKETDNGQANLQTYSD